MENLTSDTNHHGQFVLDSLSLTARQGQTFPPPSVLEEIMILCYLEQDCIFYLSHLLFFPHLYLSIPRSIPTSSHQLAAAGAPSTIAMLYRSVTAQARDERQIKTTLFPLSPSHHARLNLRFFIFFLIFLFSLELPGITWNLAVSQLDDAVSSMHIQNQTV